MKSAIARRCFKVALARASVIATLTVACALALATVAVAAQPTKTPINDHPFFDLPAGTACDFHYINFATVTGSETDFSDRTELHLAEFVTHVNVDTGYTLTERDQINLTVYPDETLKQVGVVWHLRDPDGKLVFVGAGQLIVDATGDIVKVTPHVGTDFAGIICPALGGSPA